MNTDNHILLYHCMIFGYTKPTRKKYRLTVNQLAVLASIFYATKISPQRWERSVKQCIKTINPHMNSFYILRDLNLLRERELIIYNEINPKNYVMSLTKEGERAISDLFDKEAVSLYIESNKDRI